MLVNQLVYNCRGVNLNIGVEINDLKLNLGWGLVVELEVLSDVIIYVYCINGLVFLCIYNLFLVNVVNVINFGFYG